MSVTAPRRPFLAARIERRERRGTRERTVDAAANNPERSAAHPQTAGAAKHHAIRQTRAITRDRTARSAEPILVPKVRIRFAEFPSPLSAVRPEAAHLGDLMRFWVRSHRARICIPLVRIFKGLARLPKDAVLATLFATVYDFSDRIDSVEAAP